jgi:uncharacterized protein (DUF58 family)
LIYPSRRSILIAAAIAPLALVVGVAAPAYWHIGLAAVAFLFALMAVDALLSPAASHADVSLGAPQAISVGAPFDVEAQVRFGSSPPSRVELALGGNPLVAAPEGYRRRVDMHNAAGSVAIKFEALRRGTAELGRLWLRWTGPLGLVWKQKVGALEQTVAIMPDIRPVREKSAQMLQRDAAHGLAAQLQIGEGAEYESLAEFRPGMDRRAIDWKQSARHTMLLAKEYRTERNNNIVMAVDAGRTMCEPVAGVPRVDRAVSAALLTAFVALKDGDRVGFFGFDSHPRVASNVVSGYRSFALLQQVAAQIEYSSRETNYTLALATLAERLHRRSLIIVFTDFADTVSSELMLHAVGTLLSRHLVLFILMRDEELEQVVATEPQSPADVTKAVTAASLLRQRRLVIARLRRLGVHVLEAAHDQAGPTLVNAYLDLKRRNLL